MRHLKCNICGAKFYSTVWDKGTLTKDCCPSPQCTNTTSYSYVIDERKIK